jgi:DNA-binding NarL/FixJ family response regulator
VIRVVIVDDHQMVRAGLAQLLEADADIEVIGSASDGAEGVDVVAQLTPDVVLMDLQMPVMDGVEATREIRRRVPDVQVVVLTSQSDRERILQAVDAGAVGYLLKDAGPEELLTGVKAAASGDSPLHPRAARELLAARRGSPGSSAVGAVGIETNPVSASELTPREVEVLALVRQGLVNKQIARRLGITERTVKAHLTSCFQRIGVGDRTQAALWAERNGIGDDPSS